MFEDKVHEVERLIIDEGYNELEAWRMVLTPYLLPVVIGAVIGILLYVGKKKGEVK